MAQVVRAMMPPLAKRFAYHGLKTLFRKYASSRNPPDWFGKRKVFLTVKLDRTWSGLTRLHARVGSARFRGFSWWTFPMRSTRSLGPIWVELRLRGCLAPQ